MMKTRPNRSTCILCCLYCLPFGVYEVAQARDAATGSQANEVKVGLVRWGQELPAADGARRPELRLRVTQPVDRVLAEVFRHPLLADAAETLFVPTVADLNDPDLVNHEHIKGPLLCFISPVTGEMKAMLTVTSLTEESVAHAMVVTLEAAGLPVPVYLSFVYEGKRMKGKKLERATFGMHCFWEGEAALGTIPGVVSTKPGFVDKAEVVDVMFDPNQVDFAKLVSRAMEKKVADRVYTHSKNQQEIAGKILEDRAQQMAGPFRPDKQPKYYLSKSAYAHVPMTNAQAARVNASLGQDRDPTIYLSPRQIELFKLVKSNPDKPWPNVVGANSLAQAWRKIDKMSSTSK